MTGASEVKISDDEIRDMIATMRGEDFIPSSGYIKRTRKALAAFLARRVPGAMEKECFIDPDEGDEWEAYSEEARGFNACRDRVLAGPED